MKVAEGIKIASFIPGRVRFKIQAVKDNAGFARHIEDRLGGIPGIKLVEANEKSASVLIKYDRKTLSRDQSVDELEIALNELFPGMDVSRFKNYVKK